MDVVYFMVLNSDLVKLVKSLDQITEAIRLAVFSDNKMGHVFHSEVLSEVHQLFESNFGSLRELDFCFGIQLLQIFLLQSRELGNISILKDYFIDWLDRFLVDEVWFVVLENSELIVFAEGGSLVAILL